MIVSLGCCCILCLHLKTSANKQMRLAAVTTNPSLKISHISLGNAENDYELVIDYLLELDADFVSFQELTPDWSAHLTDKLSAEYPFKTTMTRMDQYGMGFFSKINFYYLDTVYFQQVPNLVAAIKLGKDKICSVISCQVIPPVNQTAFSTISKHFNFLRPRRRPARAPRRRRGPARPGTSRRRPNRPPVSPRVTRSRQRTASPRAAV